MSVYMVERELPGISMDDLAAAQQAAIKISPEFGGRYIRSTWLPDQERCMCLFEAPSADVVQAIQVKAKIPFTRVVPALDLTP